MTTYTLNIANISFNSSIDSRDIQEEIDNLQEQLLIKQNENENFFV